MDAFESPESICAARGGRVERKGSQIHGFNVLTPQDCENGNPRPYIIKGLISAGDHVQIAGPPGTGKSAVGPHAGYCLAQGRHFMARRVRKGFVLYLAAEDGHGMQMRVRALRQRYGDTPNFRLIPDAMDLLRPVSGDYERLEKLVEELRPIAVFIDTISRAFPGLEENSSGTEGMGQVVAVARKLTALDCRPAVITVHHVAKDGGTTPRGHGVLFGDLDCAVLIEGNGSDVRSCRLLKNRNGPSDVTFAFTIGSADFGLDEDGDLVTAPIAEEIAPTSTISTHAAKERRLSDKPAVLLRELRNLLDEKGELISLGDGQAVVRAVGRKVLRSRLIQRGWFPENCIVDAPQGAELTREGYRPESHALTTLKRNGFVSFNRDAIWAL